MHIDVWGSYTQHTYTSCSYFLLIVDVFTRCTWIWIFLMKNKSKFVTHLTNFLEYVATQFKTSVQIIRSDNAKEFCEARMLLLYQSKGINHQKSCYDTPQQNGVVECKHKHLLEMAHALYFQSNVPLKFWGDCVLCACYLINRMPLSTLNFISPYEKLFGHPLTTPCIFLGYPFGQKAYKVYNLTTQKIIIS